MFFVNVCPLEKLSAGSVRTSGVGLSESVSWAAVAGSEYDAVNAGATIDDPTSLSALETGAKLEIAKAVPPPGEGPGTHADPSQTGTSSTFGTAGSNAFPWIPVTVFESAGPFASPASVETPPLDGPVGPAGPWIPSRPGPPGLPGAPGAPGGPMNCWVVTGVPFLTKRMANE